MANSHGLRRSGLNSANRRHLSWASGIISISLVSIRDGDKSSLYHIDILYRPPIQHHDDPPCILYIDPFGISFPASLGIVLLSRILALTTSRPQHSPLAL